jgi:hypothetical protein
MHFLNYQRATGGRGVRAEVLLPFFLGFVYPLTWLMLRIRSSELFLLLILISSKLLQLRLPSCQLLQLLLTSCGSPALQRQLGGLEEAEASSPTPGFSLVVLRVGHSFHIKQIF